MTSSCGRLIRCGLLLGAISSGWACAPQSDAVVVYCSVDEEFARGVLDAFTKQTGVVVKAVFDSEAGKTTGLVNRLRAEREKPRADVLYSSEVFNTIALANEGLLAKHEWRTAGDIPSQYRDADERWVAVGARGRVLAFDPQRTSAASLPNSWEELSEERFASRLAIGNPLFGTTKGHVAAMFVMWGEKRAGDFLRKLKEHDTLVVDGNSAALRAVIDGRVDLCMTDTDDVWVAQRDGARVDLAYPDMGNGGTLWIPCTVALTNRTPVRDGARRLADFLVSAEGERLLAESRSRNVPVRASLREAMHLDAPVGGEMSYAGIAGALEASAKAVRETLLK